MEEILKNAKSLPNSRLYLQAEAVQTVETGYGRSFVSAGCVYTTCVVWWIDLLVIVLFNLTD